jgi:CBS domain-containing protein
LLNAKRAAQSGPGSVVTVRPTATIKQAVHLMNDQHIGALVVVDDNAHVIGIFTERDLLRRVVAEQLPPDMTTVEEVMTRDVIACLPTTTSDELRHTMRTKRIRHLPVVDDQASLLGVLSIGDLNNAEVKVLTETVTYLEQFMTRP